MRSKIIGFLLFCMLVTGVISAQSDTLGNRRADTSITTSSNPDDEEFNLFLLTLVMIAACAMIGAAIIGAFAATTVLFLLIAFISAGILSVSALAGLYKRSLTAGFKTFLYIVCPLAGLLIGSCGAWIISRIFTIPISTNKGIIAGAAGGVAGGILMAFAVSKIVLIFVKYFWQKFNQKDWGNPK